MQTSGFFTRSVASFAISRNFAARLAPPGMRSASRRCNPEELLPVAALLVHLPQVLDRLPVVGVDGEDRLVGLHGLGLVGELRDVEVGRLRIEPDLLFGIADETRELEQRLDVLVVTLRSLLLIGQLPQLGDLRLVDGDDRRGRRGRGRRSLHRRGRRGDLAGLHRNGSRRCLPSLRRGTRRSRRRYLRDRRGLGGPWRGLQRLADLRFERAKLRMFGRDDAQALERQTRTDQVAELTPRDRPGLRQEERAVAVLDARRRFLGEVEHTGPVAGLLSVGLAQEVERALVLGVEPERLLEEARTHLEVLVPKHPAGPEGEGHGPARLGARCLLEGLVLRLLEGVESALLREQAFVQRRDLFVRRVGRIGAREEAFGLVRGEAPGNPRGAQKRSRLRVGGVRLARRADESLQAVLRGPRLDLGILEASARLGVLAAAGGKRARVSRCGLFPVALIAKDVGKLDEQGARARAVSAGLELQLEELLDHVQLAQAPVDAPGGLEALDQRRVELVRVLKVLERLHPGEKLRLEDPAQLEVELGLVGVLRRRPDPLLQLLDERLPVSDVLQIRKTLL